MVFSSYLFSTNLNAFQEKADFYINTRGVQANGQQEMAKERLESTQLVSRLGMKYQRDITGNLFFDADIRATHEYDRYTGQSNSRAYVEVNRLSVEIPSLFNTLLSAKVGRMTFRDKQTWWYDNELDALKLFHKETLLSWELSFAGRLSDERANAGDQRVSLKGTKTVIAHLDYQYYYQHHLELFGVHENNGQDKYPLGAVVGFDNVITEYRKMSWLGARAHGEFDEQYFYWGNIAYVKGDAQNLGFTNNADGLSQVTSVNNISANGLGFDFGGLYKAHNYGFGFSYAYGQGESGSQGLFLQPSSSNNKGYILGKTRYRYYGEMLDPELSNIQILSLYAGTIAFENTYLEFNYHKYTQNIASAQLKSSNLITQTNGLSKDIGQGVDVIWGGKFDSRQEVQLIISGFFGGGAFANVSQKKDGYRAVIDYKFSW